MMKKKILIFDLGGVLLNLDMEGCFDRFGLLGFDAERASASTPVLDNTRQQSTLVEGVVATGVMDLYQTGDISTEDFIAALQQCCRVGTTREQVLETWCSCLLDIPSYKLDFLCQLRDEGYRVCLLSNTNDAHWQEILKLFSEPTSTYFDRVFLSHEMHKSKPNADIFLQVLDDLHAIPEECVFVDDIQANCDAASALGIDSYRVAPSTDFRLSLRQFISSR